ncbi:MAG: asparagine synthase (glutamine-hydrolyzing) [Jatrophihabitans sp.]
MCGLAGIARIDGQPGDSRTEQRLLAMAAAVAHRGPDAHELLIDGPVGLAFARLSLVDPATGGQPLLSPDGSLALIANGEIYNHQELATALGVTAELRGGSDCEILLHLYRQRGLRFLDDVRGMYAIILWDRAANRLILARDRFGIKPLYFHRDRQRILLASEMKALFTDPTVPRRLDWAGCLANPVLSAAPRLGQAPLQTWFEGIESVPAATILQIDLRDGTTRSHEYWQLPEPAESLAATDTEVIDQYRQYLRLSIAECATADAELGLFLSGGVDSAAVAALAGKVAPSLHTFSVLSPSTFLNGDAEQAKRVADQLGLPHHQVVFEPDRLPSVFEWQRLLWLVENPMCGPEQYYKHELHRYAKQVRPELRGMLLGAAADEFTGGYSVGYGGGVDWAQFMLALDSMADNEDLRLRGDLAPWFNIGGRSLLRRDGSQPAPDRYAGYLRWEWRKIQQYNCWHEDRTAAGSGIEARVPFLDHRLVELAAGLPVQRRANLLWNKRIVRDAARTELPAVTADREKVAFYYGRGQRHTQLSFARMLQQDDAELVERALAAPGAAEHLDADAIRELAGGLGPDNVSEEVELLLRLVNLGLLSAMVTEQPVPPKQSRAQLQPPPPELRDWSRHGQDLASALRCPPLTASMVLALGEDVELVSPTDDPDRCYLVVDGEIEYLLDSDEPDWLAFFRAIDGTKSLSGMHPGLEERFAPILSEAADRGLVRAVTS